jgi:sigma-E factor negative regulatory protein RseA
MMMQDTLKIREMVSALADGQLRGNEFAVVAETVSMDVDARATWHAYHVVGDVLRSGDALGSAGDLDFVARLQKRLQREAIPLQTVDAPVLIAVSAMNTRVNGLNDIKQEGANASRFRWRLVAGLASVTAVAVLGWGVVNGPGTVSPGTTLAGEGMATESVAVVAGQPQVMIRDPRLDELLAAHKQFGGTSALQMPAGFLRNATFEVPNR